MLTHTAFPGDPCDPMSLASSSVVPALLQLASLAADLCANQVQPSCSH